MGWAEFAAGLVKLVNAILTWLGREQDRQAGRDQVRVAALKETSHILEGQRDVASQPPPSADDVDRLMRDGKL